MPDDLFLRAWKKENNTPVRDKEIVYVRKEKSLYVGTSDKPEKVGDASWEEKINDLYTKIEENTARIEEITARLDALIPSE